VAWRIKARRGGRVWALCTKQSRLYKKKKKKNQKKTWGERRGGLGVTGRGRRASREKLGNRGKRSKREKAERVAQAAVPGRRAGHTSKEVMKKTVLVSAK